MKLIADLHTHTVASTHAYSTLEEMMDTAKAGGLKALATTDHASAIPDAPDTQYFVDLCSTPNWRGDFLLLRGIEANIVDANGTLDMDDELLRSLDWVIASMHGHCVLPTEATKAWLCIAENPLVDMIGHPEQQQYPFDMDVVTKAFAKNNKVVEFNGNSINNRPGNEDTMRAMAIACMRNRVLVSVNSDAHSTQELFNQGHLLDMLDTIGFPKELVVNADMALLLNVLKSHGKPMNKGL